MPPLDHQAQKNRDILRDCLSEPILHKSAPKTSSVKQKKIRGRKTATITQTSDCPQRADTNIADDLADFIDVRKQPFLVYSPLR